MSRLAQSYLLTTDEEWTHHQPTRLVVLRLCRLIVVQDVQQHRREEEDEAARASLDAREMIHYPLGEDGEPQMSVGHVVIRLLCEHITELVLLDIVRNGKESFDLTERMFGRGDVRLDRKPYQSITLVDRQPLLTDEVISFHRLQIAHDDVLEKPRSGRASTRVIVPHPHVVQSAQRSA